MNEKPTVSYIIPCFNQANFLFETVRSIMLSYSGPKEIIIINDCSTNPSTNKYLKVIESYFPMVKILNHEKNKGLSATRNTGIALSTGRYIQLIDSDDLLLPGKIDYQIEHFRITKDLDISVTDFFLCDEEVIDFTRMFPSIGTFNLSLDDFLFKWERGLTIPIHCALIKKEVFSGFLFSEHLSAKEDWIFWCKQASLGRKITFLNIDGAVYRQHLAAMTKSKLGIMGQMWIKAGLIINDFIEREDNSFVNSTIDWYETAYKLLQNKKDTSSLDTETPIDLHQINFKSLTPHFTKVNPDIHQKKDVIFSIVVPIYNHFEYLNSCFESIFSQTFSDFEVVCVDDCSSDPRVNDYLKGLENYFPNVTIHLNDENQGISSTINKGVELARGRYIVFLDCDDYLPANALNDVYKLISIYPDTDYFFTDKFDVDENGKILREAIYGGYENIQPSGSIEEDLLNGMVASHLKIIKKDTIIKIGGLNTQFSGVQDYDLALRILKIGDFKYIHKSLYYHRQHTRSVTKSNTVGQFRNMNVARRNYCESTYPKKWNMADGLGYYKELVTSGVEYSKESLRKSGIELLGMKDITVAVLKEATREGKLIILDARIEYQQEYKYFIREYNSYLDLIHTDNPQLAISVLGSLWDDKILWWPMFLNRQRNHPASTR